MSFYELAERAGRMEEEGRRIIRLNVGNTNLPTPAWAIEAAAKGLRDGRSGYGPAGGLPGFRRRIAEREGCAAENVVVGPGSKLLLWGLLEVLRDRGQTVATPSPHWPAYGVAAERLGLRFLAVPTRMETGWSFSVPEIPEGSVLILCNPLNPTGTVFDESFVRDVVDHCRRSRIPIVIDEAYKGLAFGEIPRFESAIRLRSFSKEFSLESWRLGYAVAPKAIADKLASFILHTATCVPPFVQEAGLACLEHEEEIRAPRAAIWRSRSETAQRALAGRGFRFVPPDSGMYVFATREDIDDSDSFCRELLDRTGVALAPGSAFGGYGRFVRICANRPESELEEAIALIDELLTRP
jgi:aspartate/methionine/tyrosine aminotransferase